MSRHNLDIKAAKHTAGNTQNVLVYVLPGCTAPHNELTLIITLAAAEIN